MPFDRFLIAPSNTGLQTNLRPFLIMDDAYTKLQNALVFRGRTRKRFGSLLMGASQLNSRLAIQNGTTDGSGNFNGSFSILLPGNVLNVGAMFSVGSIIFTVTIVPTVTGAPGDVNTLSTDTGPGGPAVGTLRLVSASPNVYSFSISGSQASIATTPVFFYPANPVMGITQYENGAINDHPTYAFDTQFAYKFTGGSWIRSGTAIWHGDNLNYFWATNFQGSQTTAATPPVMFVTNFNFTLGANTPAITDDPIWSTNDGATWIPDFGMNGFYFLPGGNPQYEGAYVQTALMIIPFKNRLLLLNTVENDNSVGATSLGSTDGSGDAAGTLAAGYGVLGSYFVIGASTFTVTLPNGALTVSGTGTGTFNTATGAYTFTGAPVMTAISYFSGSGVATQYKNRCRFSINGSPFARNAWYEPGQSDSSGSVVNNNNIAKGAGYLDAATEEGIVSAEFIKDRLIVYFERSAWEIAYTGNEQRPFVWQKLNTELGSQGTFSTVPFDREVLTIGNTGIHACNGSNVRRIDDKIPDEVFDDFSVKDSNPERIQGIRDYFNELVYWAYVNTAAVDQTFPNQVLVYNYQNDSWALNDDCFTAFGYFEQQLDMTWASSAPLTWATFNGNWRDNIEQANQRQVLGGTPEGFVLRVAADVLTNAPSMQITAMTIPSVVQPQLGYIDLEVINHNLAIGDWVSIQTAKGITQTANTNYQVYFVTDANNITLYAENVAGTYLGGGTLSRVSQLQINTKQFNPYDKTGDNVYLARVDFMVERTESGEITVDYYPSSATGLSMIAQGQATEAIMGTGVLETFPYDPLIYPLEQEQDRLQHSIYFQSSGDCIQLALSLTDDQMENALITGADFQLDGMILYTQKSGRWQ